MLIAVISDIHDNLVNLDKVLGWCRANRVTKLICCGDTTTIETIHHLAAGFRGEIFMVRGNIELYDDDELPPLENIDFCGSAGSIEADGLKIAFCHEPANIEKLLKDKKGRPDFVFYGHTHKPWLEKRDSASLVNPGNVAGVWHQATFAVLDTTQKKLELKIIADIA
jgi:hypothetical protein